MSDEPAPGDDPAARPRPTFLVTKEYRRFAEFADACRRDRYVGVCCGAPGVGKTLSARHYAQWELVEPWLDHWKVSDEPPPTTVLACHTVVYTPAVAQSPRRLAEDLVGLFRRFDWLHEDARPEEMRTPPTVGEHVRLVIVNEADRLPTAGLEHLRDVYDRATLRGEPGLGLILIGLPGLKKRLARYAQLYSRIGFVHHYRALSEEELRFILAHKWQEIGLTFSPDDYTDAEALAAITRITGGNFRLVQRLFSQIERVLRINEVQTITKEVVEARENLVVGPLI